jgi:hypothetical protein
MNSTSSTNEVSEMVGECDFDLGSGGIATPIPVLKRCVSLCIHHDPKKLAGFIFTTEMTKSVANALIMDR